MIPFSEQPVQIEHHWTKPAQVSCISAILTDIEGTTTAISFVHEVLFPYAKKNVADYVRAHHMELGSLLDEVKQIAGTPDADLDQVIETLVTWMNQDKKITPLKTLQGMMWEEGYKRGDFTGHVYEDAYQLMMQWQAQGLPLYIFSSGSVQAQKLLYGFSDFGDMTTLLSGYFDTKTGPKKEASSYTTIADKIGVAPMSVLFLSDTLEELDAAKAAGMQTMLLCREGTAAPANCAHESVNTFDQIVVE
jgi:enolase-phosphatase E1